MYSSDISNWKEVTHKFDKKELSEKRKKILKCNSDIEFQNYLENLKIRNINENEQIFINNIISLFNNNNDIQILSDTKEDIKINGFCCITAYLSNISIEILKNTNIQIEDIFLIKRKIFQQINNIIYSFIEETLNYEYYIYIDAFKLEDCQESKKTFLSEISFLDEWLQYYFECYPVMLFRLKLFSDKYIYNFRLMINRLKNDINEINKLINCSTSRLHKIDLFLSDFHNNMQYTTRFELNCDKSNYIVYYKPKQLINDITWNQFIDFMISLGMTESANKSININKYNYGWQLEVKVKECLSLEEIATFYYNQGINTALAYILNVQDLIADNILAVGKFPIFIDLEMLLCPTIKTGNDFQSKSKAAIDYLQSVIKTGIIPDFGFVTINNVGHSNSGLSKTSGNKYTFVEKEGLKERTKTAFIQSLDNNIPKINGTPVEINKFCKYFENGFIYACIFIIKNKNKIIDYIKFNKDISSIKTRVLLRWTHTYSSLCKDSYMPKNMMSYYDFFIFMEMLWRGYDEVYLSEKIIEEELNQVKNGDIPYFYTYPDSKNLYTNNDKIVYKDYFKKSGIDSVIEKISNINSETIRNQLNIIRRSLYIHNNYNVMPIYKYNNNNSDCIINKIGTFLLNLSPNDDYYFEYVDYTITKDNIWSQGLQNIDLFQGVEGVGIALLSYFKNTKNKKYLDASEKIFKQSIEFFTNNYHALLDNNNPQLGIIHFPISTFYYYIIGNKILEYEHFKIHYNDLDMFIKYIDKAYIKDVYFNYFTGSVGSLLVIIELYKTHRIPELLHLIEKITKCIIHNAVECNGGLTWERQYFNKWGGIAHGNSFISYALFKSANTCRSDYFYNSAIKALKYDQSLFDHKLNVWRKSDDYLGDIHHTWGNGSAGIGLSRKLISEYYINDLMFEEIKIAINNIDKSIPTLIKTDHSICSGLLGVIEIRKLLDSKFDDESLIKNFITTNNKIKHLKFGGWEENPLVTGLYYGLAGIGYNLIKLTKPNYKIPSLLWI